MIFIAFVTVSLAAPISVGDILDFAQSDEGQNVANKALGILKDNDYNIEASIEEFVDVVLPSLQGLLQSNDGQLPAEDTLAPSDSGTGEVAAPAAPVTPETPSTPTAPTTPVTPAGGSDELPPEYQQYTAIWNKLPAGVRQKLRAAFDSGAITMADVQRVLNSPNKLEDGRALAEKAGLNPLELLSLAGIQF